MNTISGQYLTGQAVIITANDFTTGEVVYLGDDGWLDTISNAKLYPDEEQALAVMAAAVRPDQVEGAYIIAVDTGAGRISPTQYRERIRALGPTNYRHGKQAQGKVPHVSV